MEHGIGHQEPFTGMDGADGALPWFQYAAGIRHEDHVRMGSSFEVYRFTYSEFLQNRVHHYAIHEHHSK